MKRRKFLKRLGITAGAAVVTPMIATELLKDVPEGVILKDSFDIPSSDTGNIVWVEVDGNMMWYDKNYIKLQWEFETRMQKKLLEQWGDKKLTELLSL